MIAGGSGFLGLNLAGFLLDLGYAVTLISRSAPDVFLRRRAESAEGQLRHAVWDGRTVGAWAGELERAEAIVNLAGRSVDCVKTPDHQDEILRSRVESTLALGRAIREVAEPPSTWIQMSTAHRYGDSLDVLCDEGASFGYGLAPFVGAAWEDACDEAKLPDMRVLTLRTSFVLGQTGGALPRLARLVKLGLGGKIGHGRQGMSWIHEHDMNRLFHWALTTESANGAYLATAPDPVSNAEFMRHLRRALRRPIGLPAAAWMVRIGAPLFLRTDPELALYGRYCRSRRLEEEGFRFEHPELSEALTRLYSR